MNNISKYVFLVSLVILAGGFGCKARTDRNGLREAGSADSSVPTSTTVADGYMIINLDRDDEGVLINVVDSVQSQQCSGDPSGLNLDEGDDLVYYGDCSVEQSNNGTCGEACEYTVRNANPKDGKYWGWETKLARRDGTKTKTIRGFCGGTCSRNEMIVEKYLKCYGKRPRPTAQCTTTCQPCRRR